MRVLSLILLFITVSCSHFEELDRAPSSEAEEFRYGDHDASKSTVKEFPPHFENQKVFQFFYVELKDETSSYIDRDYHEFELRQNKKRLPVRVDRVLRGRYYLVMELDKNLPSSQLDFYVAGRKLKESFKFSLNPADVHHTKIRKIKRSKNKVLLELSLRDKNGKKVEAPTPPEVVIENTSVVPELEHMGNGIWHITLNYPEGNQLFYVSVRSHGVFLKNLFRFQYIDHHAR